VLKSQEADVLLHNDPIVSVFRTFGYLSRVIVSAALSVVSYDEFPDAIAEHAAEFESQMVIVPWSRGATSVLAEEEEPGQTTGVRNPFDGIFHKTTTQDQTSSVVYSEFIRKVFLRSSIDVALFVDRGLKLQFRPGETDQHLFLPYIGGPDDRLALAFLVQLCTNAGVHATVVRIRKTDSSSDEAEGATSLVSPRGATNTHLVRFIFLVPSLNLVLMLPVLDDGRRRYRVRAAQHTDAACIRYCGQPAVGSVHGSV
jgi:hypothetical protein